MRCLIMARKVIKELNFKFLVQGIIIIALLFFTCSVIFAETLHWQDFEYWDSPLNHEWMTSNPSYPLFGYGIGYGIVQTIVDFTQGSRVLDVYSQASVFNRFQRFTLRRNNSEESLEEGTEYSIISFDLISGVGLEQFEQFEFQIWLTTKNDEKVVLRYLPYGESYQIGYNSLLATPAGDDAPQNAFIDISALTQEEILPAEFKSGGEPMVGIPDEYDYSVIPIGRQYQDGSWHKIIRDLNRDIDLADNGELDSSDGFGGGESSLVAIRILGNMFRLDNISFHIKWEGNFVNFPPKLRRIGPLFAQIFKPFAIDITAEDIDYEYLADEEDLPADSSIWREPSLHPQWHPKTPDKPFLYFEAYIGGKGTRGTNVSRLLTRIGVEEDSDTYDTIPCQLEDDDPDTIDVLYNKVRFSFTPRVYENLVITIRVYDERGLGDTEVIPLTVVNFPISNYPPRLDELEDDLYLIGSDEPYYKQIIVEDFDDIRLDGGKYTPKTFFAFIDGAPYYGVGSYQEDLIKDPSKGIIEFTPLFEGVHRITVVVRDTRGLTDSDEYTLVVSNTGGWYNHPPILGEDIDSPQFVRAGQLFSIPVEFFDPDLETIYYSCNIGTVTPLPPYALETHTEDKSAWGQDVLSAFGTYRGGALYTYLTHYPGVYHIEITAYDIRGGASRTQFILDVQPWWAY